MLKRKLVISGLLVLTILAVLSLETYLINRRHQSVYSDFITIYQIQKDLGRLQLLVQELDLNPLALSRISEQWNRLYASITFNIKNLDSETGLNKVRGTLNYQSINVMLKETEEDYRLLAKVVSDTQGIVPISVDVIAMKLYAGLTNLSSHIESQAKSLIHELTLQRNSQERWVLLLVTATLLLLGLINWNVYRLILVPVERLLASIQKFGSGVLTTRSSISQNDEVGLLAASFNTMANQIEMSFATEQQLRDRLQKSHAQLIESNRLAKLGHWYWNLQTDEHSWSDEIYDIYGRDKSLSPSDYPSVQQYFTSESWEELASHVEKCRSEGIPYKVEARVSRPDGEFRYIAARGDAIRDGDEIIALFGTVQDITELKQHQEELAVSEEKYRLAMEATRDGLWDWDIKTNRVDYSPGWMNIVGEVEINHTIESWESRLHPDDRQHVLNSLRQFLGRLGGDGGIWQEEHRLKKHDGTWTWVLGRGEVVKRDENHRPLRMIGTLSDINSQKEQALVIWQQANYDSLTLLPNRKFFNELLENSLSKARRNNEEVWLLFLDLDGFKEVNDSLGHVVGDKLLIQVAERLKHSLRQADTVARLGGDEFVIAICSVSDLISIDKIASHIVESLSEKYMINGNEVYVSASMGIANYPRDAKDAKELLQYSDQSMYAAKSEGKNRYNYFTASLQHESQLRIELATLMRTAIKRQEFKLYYQPIIDLHTDEIHKAEALIRWHHPDKGEFLPDTFIPLAEETGLICEIGIWIYRQVLQQLAKWLPYDENLQISVNMSPAQIKKKDKKYQEWIDELSASPLFKNRLVIEITENLLLDNDNLVKQKLIQYKDLGIQVAIDDFGTGYSSLSYLKKFDIDYLKIDQSFVGSLASGSTEEEICKAIITMAHNLGIKVIAEGVETKLQSDILKQLQCDFAQGRYYCGPVPVTEFESRIFSKKH